MTMWPQFRMEWVGHSRDKMLNLLPKDTMQIVFLWDVVDYQEKVQTSQDGMGMTFHETSCSQTGGLLVLY